MSYTTSSIDSCYSNVYGGIMRATTYKVLSDSFNKRIYVNLRLKQIDSDIIGNVTIRTYGILQNFNYLEFLLDSHIQKKKLDDKTRLLLIMAIYEKNFMDNIPIYAIKNEYINLSKKVHNKSVKYVSYFMNNILSDIIFIEPTFKNEIKNIAILTSHPIWYSKLIEKQYPIEYRKILDSSMTKKELRFRKVSEGPINTEYRECEFSDLLSFSGRFQDDEDFKVGNVVVQDIGSYLVSIYLNAMPSDIILDLCAAPGSKTLHLSKYAKTLYSNEINESRYKLLKENVEKHKAANVITLNFDGRTISEHFTEKVDKILVDAPCSGTGCFSSKPEIKFNITTDKIKELVALQRELFDEAIKVLPDDAQIIYSTCSILDEENVSQVEYFIEKYNLEEVREEELISKFSTNKKYGLQLLPHSFNSDGFYVCKLKRKINE